MVSVKVEFTITHEARTADCSSHRTSTITQYISLTAASSTVFIHTEVDWHGDRQLLKAEFPYSLRTQEALYESQYGYVSRPTHSNTSWDMAKFEVCGHRWAAVCDHGYGFGVINDSKYGYSCRNDTLALVSMVWCLLSQNHVRCTCVGL